jgi:Zn-dependent protease with chaperone function
MLQQIHYFLVLGLAMVMVLTSCAYHPPPSPYSSYYDARFTGVQLPTVEDIQRVGTVWTFARPLDEVWEACLRVLHQYEGMLRLHTDEGKQRRVLFVHGQEMHIKARDMEFNKLLDTWIAVALSAEEGGSQTTVAAAWVSPTTGGVAPFDALPPSGHQAISVTSQARMVQNFEAIAAALSREGAQLTQQLNQTKKPKERWKFVPQATINEFFYHLVTQLYGPERWWAKFATASQTPQTVRALPDLTHNTVDDDQATLEHDLGNWTSARLRRSFVVVHSPEVETTLRGVVDRLQTAATVANRQVRVYIIASPEINAFTVPNGDIFVCSGLLEALESIDEVAAVMGHELDHFLQHDTMERLESLRRSRILFTVIVSVAAVGGADAGAAIAAPLAAAGAATSASASASTSITTNVLSNLATNAIQTAGGVVAQSVGTAIVSGHSQEAELRADANGARYLWAAGYDVDAELSMLAKLQDLHAQAKKRNEVIASGFLNAKPGLEERLKAMQETRRQLRSPPYAK